MLQKEENCAEKKRKPLKEFIGSGKLRPN